MALGQSDTFNGESFTRSMNNFGSLPTAVFGLNGTGTSVALGNSGLYSYLWAHYGGPGGGTVKVWYVGDLSGTITIPASDGHGLSGWTLFGPGVPGVPDGGDHRNVARCSPQCAWCCPTLLNELTRQAFRYR